MSIYAEYPFEGGGGGGGGVTSLNGETGAVTLVAGSGISVTPSGSNITIAATGGGSGTVTSVGLTVPAFLSVSGSPITSSGTLAVSYSGTALPVVNGGTGSTSFAANSIPYSNGTILTQDNANFYWNDSSGILGLKAAGEILFNASAGTSSINIVTSAANVAGGALSIGSGIGGDTSTSSAAGAGGDFTVNVGNGGSGGTGPGGAGGNFTLNSGNAGGESSSGTAAEGGFIDLQAGNGGNNTSTGAGGQGGTISIEGGMGGFSDGSSNGGDGGDINLYAGSAGGTFTGNCGEPGIVSIVGGNADSSSFAFVAGGAVYLNGGIGSDDSTEGNILLSINPFGAGGLVGIGIESPAAQLHVQSLASSTVVEIIQGSSDLPSQTADLTEWQNASGTVLSKVDFNGNITAPTFNPTAAQTTLTGSAGTAVCSQPFQGSSYKKVIIYLNGYTDTGTHTYTFPTSFSHTPFLSGLTAGVSGATVSTTSIKFTVTLQTGFVFAEGY